MTIPSGKPAENSLDFKLLKDSGLNYLEQLTGKIWTDYNAHDPGITILEVLSYALTELGLKVNQPVEDLISSSNGPTDSLFDIAELLSSEAITSTDFEKVLVDLPELKNTWLTTLTEKAEVSFYYDESIPELNYNTGHQVQLKGLWDLLFEFNETSLNTNVISRTLLPIDDRQYIVDIVFPYWDQLDSRGVGSVEINITSSTLVQIPGEVPGTIIKPNGKDEYLCILQVDYNAADADEFPIYIKLIPGILPAHLPIFIDQSTATNPILQLLDTFAANSVLDDFNTKNNLSRQLVSTLSDVLNTRRNICEDFAFYRTVRTQEIAVRVDIELHSDTDIVDTLAEILFQIDQFLSPIISHQGFYDMLNEKEYVSKVYEGPLLQNGFLSDEDITGLERVDTEDGEQVIFTSDIIGLIKNLNESEHLKEGSRILDIKNLKLSNYINNILVTTDARNCLKLTQSHLYKPKLSPSKSTFQVFQFGLLVDINMSEVVDRFNQKYNEALSIQQSYPVDVLSPPEGESQEIREYNSIQYDFPLTYKLKPGELGSTHSKETYGKVKQLKAYLSFYDQFLLNNTQQLGNLNELFAIYPSDERTYYYESMDVIPGMQDLLAADYNTNLQDILENLDTQLKRRNQFLDHLLARHAENPADFKLLSAFYLNLFPNFNSLPVPNQQVIMQQINESIVNAKRQFLGEYLELSSQRMLGFNYTLLDSGIPDVWDTTNVSGFNKRLSRLLGIQNYERRTLSAITSGVQGEGEGFHLLEHVLLRPRSNGLGDIIEIDELLNVAIGYRIYPDPYSFTVTLVFPSGFERDFSDVNSEPVSVPESARFQFLNMRTHVEHLIRRELPAHVLFHIFWLDRNTVVTNNLGTPSLNEFEAAYQNWLEVVADPASDEVARINARASLIQLMNELLISKA